MTHHTTTPTADLELGDTILIGGHELTVKRCHCGDEYSIDVPQELLNKAGLESTDFHHEPLDSLTKSVRKLFEAAVPEAKPDAPEVPALAAGQVWRTRGGETVTIHASGENFRAGGKRWWYTSHKSGSKHCHTPGILHELRGDNHPDTLVQLIEAAVPEDKPLPAIAVGQTWRTRDGEIVKVEKNDRSAIPFQCRYVNRPGRFWVRRNHTSAGAPEQDLVQLIEASPRAITLVLASDEAETLLQVTRSICGSPDKSRRGLTDAIGQKLRDLGVQVRNELEPRGSLDLGHLPLPLPGVKPKAAPIFKVGEVWKGKRGHLLRIDRIDEAGIGYGRVIHNPAGEYQYSPDFDGRWAPQGGYSPENNAEDLIALTTKVSD